MTIRNLMRGLQKTGQRRRGVTTRGRAAANAEIDRVHVFAVARDRPRRAFASRRSGHGFGAVCHSAVKYGSEFKVLGSEAFSGIREMYARDVYLRGVLLNIEPGDIVVDLGANMGNFTCIALAADPTTHVIAIEPSRTMNKRFMESVGLNEGFLPRTRLVHAFIGAAGDKQT